MSGTHTQAEVAAPPAASAAGTTLPQSVWDPWTVREDGVRAVTWPAIVIIVAVFLLWLILTISGTFSAINQTISDLGGSGSAGLDVADAFSFGRPLALRCSLPRSKLS